MTDDLETLLRDAGREPTIDLDVDAIAAAGARRAVGRRVGGAVAAVAAVAVAVAVVPGLLSTTPPDIDIAPEPDGAATTESDGVGDAAIDLSGIDPALVELLGLDLVGQSGGTVPPGLRAAAVSTATGLDLVDVGWDDAVSALDVTRVRADGTVLDTASPAGPILADPVVATDGAVWWTEQDGSVRRTATADGTSVTTAVLERAAAAGWIPVGAVADTDEVLVSRVAVGGVEVPGGLALLSPDGSLADVPVEGVAGLVAQDGVVVVDAHVARERIVVAVIDDAATVRVLVGDFGGELRALVEGQQRSEAAGSSYLAGVGLVGDEVWVVEAGEARGAAPDTEVVSSIRRFELDGTERVPTPLPSTLTTGQVVADLRVSPDGQLVLVGTVGLDSDARRTVALFPAVVDRVEDPALAVRRLDTGGTWSAAGPTAAAEPLAACADDPLVPVNQEPVLGGVLFLCDDATASLGPGEVWAFVEAPGLTDVETPLDAPTIRAVLDLWAAGPTDAQRADGLSGGLDPATATVRDVTIDGTTVVVDLAPGPQVGVLGTSGGRSQFVQAVTGMVLADEYYDAVRITLDGDCAAWSVLGDSEGCATSTRADAAWAQGAAACARDEALNTPPSSGQVVVWRWCPDSVLTLPTGIGLLPVPVDGVTSSTPTEGQLLDLLLATFAPVTDAEVARGIDAPGLVLDATAEPDLFDAPGVTVGVEGSRVVVDYDPALADRMQISAPFAESLMVTAIAGAVFQFDELSTLELRVGGSCEAYAERLEGESTGCTIVDRRALPWTER